MASVHDHSAITIDGQSQSLSDYAGRVLLIVNVASRCGFTPQYTGLESMYRRLAPKGFAVLGFPCNQFGHQEPGDEAEIRRFCSTSYDVTFPMYARIEVNGPGTHPLYAYLKSAAPGLLGTTAIKWNFTKFLVDGRGRALKRFAPTDTPAQLSTEVEKLL